MLRPTRQPFRPQANLGVPRGSPYDGALSTVRTLWCVSSTLPLHLLQCRLTVEGLPASRSGLWRLCARLHARGRVRSHARRAQGGGRRRQAVGGTAATRGAHCCGHDCAHKDQGWRHGAVFGNSHCGSVTFAWPGLLLLAEACCQETSLHSVFGLLYIQHSGGKQRRRYTVILVCDFVISSSVVLRGVITSRRWPEQPSTP